MERIITKIAADFKRDAEEFLAKGRRDIRAAEEFFVPRIGEMVTELLSAVYEEADRELLEDRAGRRQAGLVVERRGEPRTILSQLGSITYKRAYYQRQDGTYSHPVDEIAGVEAYERISARVSEELVDAAREMPYRKSSRVVTNGAVSSQTVMNKIRRSSPKAEIVERVRVPVLHVDADEDHVKLHNGNSTYAPLISVYTGIEKQGKRGICKDIFHISEYGRGADDLWETALNEMERRYDLSDTKIYLHGDGAAWIKAGLGWLPNCTFVLDRYHVNKALQEAVSGMDAESRDEYRRNLFAILREGNEEKFLSVRKKMLACWPDREESIMELTDYLLDNFQAIHIWHTDPEARNGGATESHVSNVLSARLSSRPMAWSKDTLRRFLPILAAGSCALDPREDTASVSCAPESRIVSKARRKAYRRLGLPDPDRAVQLPGASGKVTPLYNALRPFIYPWPCSPTTT